MTDKQNVNNVNVEISEDHTTKAPNDVFEKAELTFPCEFPISVMGKNTGDYVDIVFAILKKHVPEVTREGLTLSYSGGQKYCSIRTRFTAQSRGQMDALYQELTAHELVKWVL